MPDGDKDGRGQEDLQWQQQSDAHARFDDAVPARWCDGRLPATVANHVALLVAVAIAWLLMYVNVAPELTAFPGGSLTSIFLVYVTGTVAGRLITKVGGLPPLLGMMLAGIVLRNTGLYTVNGWCSDLVAAMR